MKLSMISSGNDVKRPFVVISCPCCDKVLILLSLTVMARISMAQELYTV